MYLTINRQDFLEETGYKDSDSNNPEVEAKFNKFLQDNEETVRMLISEWGKPINGEEDNDDELYENKKNMKLTESKLRKMVAECLKEIGDTPKGQYMLGQLQGRQAQQGKRDEMLKTMDYANKKLGQRTSQNFQDYDAMDTCQDMGFMDKTDPQLSKDIETTASNQGIYRRNLRNNCLKESDIRKMVAEKIREALEDKSMFSVNYYDNNGIVDRSFDPDGNLFDTYEKAEEYAQKHAAKLSKKAGTEVKYEIKREPNWKPFANSVVSNEKVEFIKNIAKDLGNVKLSKACGKYYAIVDNGEETLALSFKGENGYDQTPIDILSPQVIQTIYNDLYQDFGEE